MLLIRWDGATILTDPWFGMLMRGLPVFVRPCIAPKDLPKLDLILVSHFHTDHFDLKALRKMPARCEVLVMPPGLKTKPGRLRAQKIIEVKDGDAVQTDTFSIRAFSVEHSGYENAYLVERNGGALVFAGDAKYSPVFRHIAHKRHPLVSLLPVGGTRVFGRKIVMDPKDAMKAAIDLGTKVVVPIHPGGEWMSVPPLSLHPGRCEAFAKLAKAGNAPFAVAALKPGQRVRIDDTGKIMAHATDRKAS